MRRLKILCTLGPASADIETLRQLVDAGMDAARLNFSHGTIDEHREMLARVRQVAREKQCPLPIVQDLQGPKIRVGDLGPAGMELTIGQQVRLCPTQAGANADTIPILYDLLCNDLRPADPVLLDDGQIALQVVEVEPTQVLCTVVQGGRLLSRKGVNLPGTALSVAALTEKDIRDLEAGLAMGVDIIALSFVRSAKDIEALRERIHAAGAHAPILAKIEKPEAVQHFDEILAVSDGVLVARGDLGVELPPQQVPLLQRRIVRAANAKGKLVLIATQMLDSMVHNPRPTRAEVSDVATAVMQGADGAMLAGETAAGQHPVAAVKMMASIIEEVESGLAQTEPPPDPPLIADIAHSANAIGHAAIRTAQDVSAECIAVFTRSGHTACLVSDYRPRQPIVAFTPRYDVYRWMGMLWGVTPVLLESSPRTLERAAHLAREHASRLNLIKPGQRLVLTAGLPAGRDTATNLLWIQTVEDLPEPTHD